VATTGQTMDLEEGIAETSMVGEAAGVRGPSGNARETRIRPQVILNDGSIWHPSDESHHGTMDMLRSLLVLYGVRSWGESS